MAIEDLKPYQWKKGVSGNPRGRPRRPDIELLNKVVDDSGLDKQLVATWLRHAFGDEKKGIKPDFRYFEKLLEYRNGKVPLEIINDVNSQEEEEESLTDAELDGLYISKGWTPPRSEEERSSE